MKLQLDTSVQYIKGVGPHLAGLLARKNIATTLDLLLYFPRSYEDRRAIRSICNLQPGESVSLVATIQKVSRVPLGKTHRFLFDVVITDPTGKIHCKFFRSPYKGFFEKLKAGLKVRVVGKVTLYGKQFEFMHPEISTWGDDEEVSDELLPIYEETEGLSSKKIQTLLRGLLDQVELTETLPPQLVKKLEFPSRAEAIKSLHLPPKTSGNDFLTLQSPYHRRIIFEDFFWLELAMALRKAEVIQKKTYTMTKNEPVLSKIVSSLPFRLTSDQGKALEEITQDICSSRPMNRLLQGDVGSGKTIVAFLSAALTIANGYQVALMAPTEILAEQHFLSAKKFMDSNGIKTGLVVGGQNKDKSEAISLISENKLDLIVGTHALIQNEIQFSKLGLVIIDEQHRFGVAQRKVLAEKSGGAERPHILIMTATPIPRTLSMTVYGDLDVSLIKELPQGRSPIFTRVANESKRESVYDFLSDKLKEGGQAYIVFPLVEESEKIDLKDALSSYELLKTQMPNFRIGLLHGRMKPLEKESIMESFRQHAIDILVSTTVIEVGVDVPNANIMIVEHAERFGLSQLHQLRGRVGRGSRKSYCILMTGYGMSQTSKERLKIMESTTDGFEIAESDLKIRGPGELLGEKQSGLNRFHLANIFRDIELLKLARDEAFAIVSRDAQLQAPEHRHLKDYLVNYSGYNFGGIG